MRDGRAEMLEAVEAGEWAAIDVRPLPIEFAERPYLRLAQINDYPDACAAHYRPLAALLIGTGARLSEAIALGLEDVDLDAGAVRIHKQRVRGQSPAVRPKKGRNFRAVAIGSGAGGHAA